MEYDGYVMDGCFPLVLLGVGTEADVAGLNVSAESSGREITVTLSGDPSLPTAEDVGVTISLCASTTVPVSRDVGRMRTFTVTSEDKALQRTGTHRPAPDRRRQPCGPAGAADARRSRRPVQMPDHVCACQGAIPGLCPYMKTPGLAGGTSLKLQI